MKVSIIMRGYEVMLLVITETTLYYYFTESS